MFENKHIKELISHLEPERDLRNAAALLHWDLETGIPEKGLSARSRQLATLGKMAHEILTSNRTDELLNAAENDLDTSADTPEAALVRRVRMEFDQATCIPPELVEKENLLTSRAFSTWKKAREEDRFETFRSDLKEIVELNREKAERFGYSNHPYDALLNLYEPGLTTEETGRLFDEIKTGLIPIVNEARNREPVDASFLSRPFLEEKQWDFSRIVLEDMGFDFQAGRLDASPHPFTTSFSPDDVRITTRVTPDAPLAAILSSVHEGGHALYEQGIPTNLERTHLGQATGLGLHESQSRLWENQVARSPYFWDHYFPVLKAFFPEALRGVDLEDFLPALNRTEAGLIRVDADEVTYNLHIFLRFELEVALIKGDLKVDDLPAAWNEKMEQYLGIQSESDTDGCLQDIHWSHGAFGYFPTYTIGNLLAAQFFEQIRKEIPEVEGDFSTGNFRRLLDWLRNAIHRHGARYNSRELIHRISGGEIRTEPLLNRLRVVASS